VKLLGCNWHAAPYVMLARPGIGSDRGSARQVDCRIVARHAAGHGGARRAGAAKLPPSEVKLAAVGGDRDRFTALLGGVVDAAVVSNEYMPLPAVKDMRVLVEARQVLPKFLRFCTLMTGKTLAERREDAVRFMARRSRPSATPSPIATRPSRSHARQPAPRPTTRAPPFIYEEGLKPGVVDPEFSIRSRTSSGFRTR
jgi:NitT/TauT family transport system substrate-binding protein